MTTQQGFPSSGQPVVAAGGLITQPWRIFFNSIWQRTGGNTGGSTVAPGFVMDFAGPDAPDGWLACDGTAVSRETYSSLFGAIGTTWGSGDGLTTFNLPDLRNKFAVGAGSVAVGGTGGSATVTLATGNLPAHNHAVVDPGHTHTVTDPGHVHTLTDPGHHHTALVAASTNTAGAAAGSSTSGNTGTATTGITMATATTGVTNNSAHTGVTTSNTGSGTPISTLPPYGGVLKVIKT